jgi:thymidylate synthase
MKDGFPLLTTKKMAWKTMVTELLWFLQGSTNIKYLVDNGCHIWDGDAYKNYEKNIKIDSIQNPNDIKWNIDEPKNPKLYPLTKEEFIDRIKTDDEFAKKWGDLGPLYGKQWRNWGNRNSDDYIKSLGFSFENSFTSDLRRAFEYGHEQIDQIQNLINDLKTNPDSRRLIVSAWNVGELDQMVLPPCHYGFQVYTRELSEGERGLLLQPYGLDPLTKEGRDRLWKENNLPTRAISLMWNQRSCDFPLGIPMNISSYALLLMMIADEVNMVPDELIGNLGDCHIYLNQIDGVKEQITREPYPLPTVHVRDGIFCSSVDDVILENYQSHLKIHFPLSN